MNPKVVRILFIVAFVFLLPAIWVSKGLSMIITGLLAAFYTLWYGKIRHYIITNGIRVEGFVIKNRSDGEGGLLSNYEFITKSGTVITGDTFCVTYSGETGNTVTVLYHPKYPKTFLVEERLSTPKNYAIGRIIIGAGIILLIALGYWIF